MKGSIISPLWFYLIDVLGNVKTACDTMFYLLIIIFIVAIILYYIFRFYATGYLNRYGEDDKDYQECKFMGDLIKYIYKISIILSVLLGSLSLFIPSKETMYTMMVANYVTYENVEAATDVIQDSVDYIMDKLDKDDKDKE